LIEFKKIKFKNFLSYGNTWAEILLDVTDTTLVKGTNGNGKSTFLDAITYSLFGKGFRKSSTSDLINNINRKGLIVEVEFVAKGSEYKIIRGLKPARFDIWVDGVQRHNDAKIKDQQVWLEQNVIGMNDKSFRQIVVLGTGNYTPFMRLPAGDRRKVIEQLLDIEIFGLMNDVLRKKSIELKVDISDMEHRMALLNTSIETDNKHITANELKRKVSKDKAHTEVVKLQALIDQLLSDNESLIPPPIDGIDEKKEKIRKIQAQTESKMKLSSRSIKLFNTKSQCPTCDQGISSEFKDYMIITHTKIKNESEGNLDLMEDMWEELNNVVLEHNNINSKYNTNSHEISKYQNLIESIHKTMEDIEGDDDTIFEKELKEKVERVYNLQKMLYNLLNKTRLFNVIELMLKDTGIKTRIIKKYLPVLNTIINKYLKEFEFNITLTLDELFNETVTKNGRELYGYVGFSEGEKLRMDLAILFAFRELAKIKNSVSTNLLILDEILDSSLDRAGIEHFLKIIRGQENSKIYVISHKGDLGDHFKRTIKVSKNGQFSNISETTL
jgi:DNA repair exonuclease SbcCD ATPase subunit